jgi:hypothetical protein
MSRPPAVSAARGSICSLTYLDIVLCAVTKHQGFTIIWRENDIESGVCRVESKRAR